MKMRSFSACLFFFLLTAGSGTGDFTDSPDIYRDLRNEMVDKQIVSRGIDSEDVLGAMRSVARHLFVPEEYKHQAYDDHAIPIGYGQTISQPFIVAIMTQLLQVVNGDKVLEIGTGSGYQAAVLSLLTDQVYTMEILVQLEEAAEKRLKSLGYDSVEIQQGDGYYGWPEEAPFDKIIVTAAAGHVPPPLIDQLKPGGIIIIPIGRQFEVQYLTMILKDSEGDLSSRQVLPVRFVPFVGQAEK